MYYGADYYPEHWPKERWAEDARLMKEANINVVRLAEFAWAKLEPAEGHYDFSWLDEAIDILGKEGIKAVIGTPTATPPKWLVDKYPDIYMKDRYGHVRGFGSRRHYCYNSPVYHEYTKRIVSKIAKRYGVNENVIAWQIDNEFGCQDTGQCYCENCQLAFREWLKERYGSLENLNRAWGTVFWSQTYNDWDEIILPYYTVCEDSDHRFHGHNPGLLLDFYRFSSDSVVSYQKLQVDLIREFASQPITHNLMGHFPEIDYFKLGKDLDFVSWDNYPRNQWRIDGSDFREVAMAHDLMRGVKDKGFWVMEQQSGPCGWSVMGRTPKPGQLRLWTYQAVAHGAEAIVYFRWRTCAFGAEEYWYGILDHDGIPRRRYGEVQKTGKELQAISDIIVGSRVVSETAIIKSYDNLWSHRIQPHSTGFDYNTLLMSYYKGLINNNINTDVISIDHDLDRYKVVFMPAFNLVKEDIIEKIEEYVKNGGNLVLTFRSGSRNWDNSMRTDTLPGGFRKLAGIEVEEFDSLNQDCEGITGIMGDGTAITWCDILKPNGAGVLAVYASGYYRGSAAITVNTFGKGKVYYVGCGLDQKSLDKLIESIAGEAEVGQVLPWKTEGVEAVKKEKDGKPYIMVLNHNPVPVIVDTGGNYTDLLTGGKINNKLEL
ncbi:MAG: beta-galactosidase, partial [Caldicoprobacteraceae bacterium]